jgi:hypothetical protein
MVTRILHRKSASGGAVPTTAAIQLGEIAINTFDGKLFIKKNNGVESIVEIGGAGGGNTFSTISVSGQSDVVADSTSDTLTIAASGGVTITTNATTDTITIATQKITVGTTAPSSPSINDLWVDTN